MSRFSLVLLTFLSLVSPCISAGPAGTPHEPEANWRHLRQILAKRVSLRAKQAPLHAAVAALAKQTGVRMVIDRQALDDLGIGLDEPVSVQLSGVTLESMLVTMLGQIDLTWSYRNEAVWITTEEEEENALVTRVYPVGDLKDRSARYGSYPYDVLIDAIISTVASDTWAENGGGEAEVRPVPTAQALIVSQTIQVQLQIEDLLNELRRVGLRQGGKLRAPPASQARAVRILKPRTYLIPRGVWCKPRVYEE